MHKELKLNMLTAVAVHIDLSSREFVALSVLRAYIVGVASSPNDKQEYTRSPCTSGTQLRYRTWYTSTANFKFFDLLTGLDFEF